jgi:RimJ/RimL family protein N-acetyltransferase
VRHEVRLQGHAFALRPVEIADAGFILNLRQDPQLARYIHPVSPRLSDQEQWIRDYLEREHDYYFIIERLSTAAPEGTVGLYDVNPTRGEAEWGRWILRRGSGAALESSILIYRFAFDLLGLDLVYCRTVADNARVVSFHSSFGLMTVPDGVRSVTLGDVTHDVVEQRLTADRWRQLCPGLDRRATAFAQILSR